MGAWGFGPLDNDAAQGVVTEVTRTLVDALREGTRAPRTGREFDRAVAAGRLLVVVCRDAKMPPPHFGRDELSAIRDRCVSMLRANGPEVAGSDVDAWIASVRTVFDDLSREVAAYE